MVDTMARARWRVPTISFRATSSMLLYALTHHPEVSRRMRPVIIEGFVYGHCVLDRANHVGRESALHRAHSLVGMCSHFAYRLAHAGDGQEIDSLLDGAPVFLVQKHRRG